MFLRRIRLFMQNLSMKSIILFTCQLMIVLGVLVLCWHLFDYYLIGKLNSVLNKPLFPTSIDFLKPPLPSISLTMNMMGTFGILHLLTKRDAFVGIHKCIKFVTVNFIPINWFLNLASVFPIGDWLEYEILGPDRNTWLNQAVQRGDKDLLDKILKYTPKEMLYKMLTVNDADDVSPLHHATNILNDNKLSLMHKIIMAIEPERLCSVLKNVKRRNRPYFFHVLLKYNCENEINLILERMPQRDRWEFLSQLSENGFSVIAFQASYNKSSLELVALLKYIPSEKLIPLLNVKNSKGKTALMYFADETSDYRIKTIFSLIPKDQLKDFFAFENQGKWALLYANTVKDKHKTTFKVLESYGLSLTEEEKKMNRDDMFLLENDWEAAENFKSQRGEYPHRILELLSSNPKEEEVKKAYKAKMLIFHPDKQTGENKDVTTVQEITEAYEFLTKEEVRTAYLNRKF